MNKNTIFSIGIIGLVGYLIYKVSSTKNIDTKFTLKKETPTKSTSNTASNTTSTSTAKSEDDLLIEEIEKYKSLLEKGQFPAALFSNPKLYWIHSSDTSKDEWFILNAKTKKLLYTMKR